MTENIFDAARYGEISTLETFLRDGGTIDPRNEKGRTLLALAVRGAHVDAVDFLLARGADVNAEDRYGWSVLHVAASVEEPDLIERLLKHGADPRANRTVRPGYYNSRAAASGSTPLHEAVRGDDPGVIELLLAYGADINATDVNLHTPLDVALPRHGEMLKKAGGVGFYEALHEATMQEDIAQLRKLAAAGANFRIRSADGYSLLHTYACHGHVAETAAVLVELGADPHDQGTSIPEPGDTPLHVAAGHGNAVTFEALLRLGAAINAVNDNFATVLDAASERFVEKVRAAGGVGVRDELYDAVERGDTAKVRALLDAGANPHTRRGHRLTRGDLELTLLASALRKSAGGAETAQLLLDRGAEVRVANIVAAARLGYDDLLRSMLKKGPALTQENCSDDGALMLPGVAAGGLLWFLDQVLALGVDVNQKDEEGCTAIAAAVAAGHLPCVQRLIEAGANLRARLNGKDLLALARTKPMREYLVGLGLRPAVQKKESVVFRRIKKALVNAVSEHYDVERPGLDMRLDEFHDPEFFLDDLTEEFGGDDSEALQSALADAETLRDVIEKIEAHMAAS